jgi:DUF4097 and DUF4098 domain-containing protein YvlB
MERIYQVLCVVLLFVANVLGQGQAPGEDHVSVRFSDPSRPGLLKASLLSGGITVRGYEGKEVVIEARVRARESSHETSRSDGMRRIATRSTGLSVEEENNVMTVSASTLTRAVDLTIQVPTRTSVKLKSVNEGDIKVDHVDGEIEVNNINGGVMLSDISGSAVAHALNGRVLVTFIKIDPQKPMSFSSLNGTIDVTFPASLRANVRMRSDMGDIYSDFDIRMQDTPQAVVEDSRNKGGHYRVHIDKTMYGTINGGGPEIQFKNFNGSIYIRKAGK